MPPSPRSRHAHPIRAGFTLVELLVVIGIIALLIGILLPTLSRARASAFQTQCASNLRQMGLGWTLYANDHDYVAMPALDYSDAPSRYLCWWGEGRYDSGFEFVREEGLLWPYMQGEAIRTCPVFPEELEGPWNQTGLGYNWQYLSPQKVDPATSAYIAEWNWTPLARIRNATRKVLFADTARNAGADPYPLQSTGYLQSPSYADVGYPSFHARHEQAGNVVWTDGHVSTEPARILRETYLYGIPAEAVKQSDLGDLDDDGDPTTDELFDPEYAG